MYYLLLHIPSGTYVSEYYFEKMQRIEWKMEAWGDTIPKEAAPEKFDTLKDIKLFYRRHNRYASIIEFEPVEVFDET